MKTHERPFKCEVSTCKYYLEGFPTGKERKRHQIDIHALVSKEWKCRFSPCQYKSYRESNCKQHMEKAHNYVYKRMKRNPRRRSQEGQQTTALTQRRRRNAQQVPVIPLGAPTSQSGASIPPQERESAWLFSTIPQADDIPSVETTDPRQPLRLDVAEGLSQPTRGVHAELTNCSSHIDLPAAGGIFGDYNAAPCGYPDASPTLTSEDFYLIQSTGYEQWMEPSLPGFMSQDNSFGQPISGFHHDGLDFTETLGYERESDTPNGSYRNRSS